MACFVTHVWHDERMKTGFVFPMLMMALLGCATGNDSELFDEASQEDRNKAAVKKLEGQKDTVAVFARGLC